MVASVGVNKIEKLFEVDCFVMSKAFDLKGDHGVEYAVAFTPSEAIDKIKNKLYGIYDHFYVESAREIKVSGYKINLEKIVE